ncbi:hypothetical protein [Jiangella asiatica]|uniref:Uncharacterized protein n=1 Tax=Jiangella asiatica TaxID=2530372 RepID=A0A4R5DMS6_9ACTN|nr:hypothetical protein [Jiangella asiatica]TDE12205.1 hypothetical protein E1269_07905 [Jiangella asiatica]
MTPALTGVTPAGVLVSALASGRLPHVSGAIYDDRDAVELGDGRELPSEVRIWAAGFGAPDPAVRSAGQAGRGAGHPLNEQPGPAAKERCGAVSCERARRPGDADADRAGHVDGELDGVLAMRVDDARTTDLYLVRNPDELTCIDSEIALTLR